jgi:MFS family permease
MPDAIPSELVAHIRQKRQQVDSFLAKALPQKKRLLNVTILGGTLAAALTVAPAVGGQAFTSWMTNALGLTSPAWRLLCGLAAVCSVLSTVATQFLKSHNLEERVTRALSCRAKLEVLEIGMATGQLSPSQATTEYMRCVEESAFLDG